MNEINVGDRVRDIVTGFEGIVICRTHWLTGCDTVQVKPEKLHEGKILDNGNFDVTQVELVQARVVVIGQSVLPSPQTRITDLREAGGPHDSVPRQR